MADNHQQWSEIVDGPFTVAEKDWIREDLIRFAPEESGGILRRGDEVLVLVDENGDWTEEGESWTKEHPAFTYDDDLWPGFDWSFQQNIRGEHLWLSGDGGSNLEHVADFLHRFIRKFRPNLIFKLTWGEWCDAPRVGEFGGGWLVAHKDGVEWGHAHDQAKITHDLIKHPWLDDKLQFARLLCEMGDLGLPDGEDRADLCENMNLTDNDITELFERAREVLEG